MEERQLLNEYKKCVDQKRKKEIYNLLIDFIIKTEMEMSRKRSSDPSFRPHNQDEFVDKRDLMFDIRKEFNLYHKSPHQHPPENIEEIRGEISQNLNEKED